MMGVSWQTRKRLDRGGSAKVTGGLDSLMSQVRHPQVRESGNGEKASIAKLFEQGKSQLTNLCFNSSFFIILACGDLSTILFLFT